MVDSDLGGGDASPLALALLRLEESPSRSFDPIKEWLLDSDHHTLRSMPGGCSDSSPIDSGGAKISSFQERFDLSDVNLEEAAPLTTDCEAERVEKDPYSSADTEPLGEGRRERESGVAHSLDNRYGGEHAVKEENLEMDSSVPGECRKDLKNLGGVGEVEGATTTGSKEIESESDEETESSSSSEEEGEVGIAVGEHQILGDGSGEDVEIIEIKKSEIEEVILSSDDEEGAAAEGPIRSKNELDALPPVPPVNVVLGLHHQTLPVGIISSIIGSQVIIDGKAKHNPLNEGSIIWITETRSPLGIVDEIFGPVKNPYYIVRYNSINEVPTGIHEGTEVSFVPEFCNVILNQNELFKKGYDASGKDDEEASDECEFSDDEKEAEYKKSLKTGRKRMENRRNSSRDSFSKKNNRFKGNGPHGDMQHKTRLAVTCTGTAKPKGSTATPFSSGSETRSSNRAVSSYGNRAPSAAVIPSGSTATATFSSGSETRSSNRAVPSYGNRAPSAAVIPRAMQPDGFPRVQQQILLQQPPNSMWMPGVTIPQQNTGMPVPIHQQSIGLPGGFGVNVPFQHQQSLQQIQPQLQQQQFFPGLPIGIPNGFPFQQQVSSYQGPAFNLPSPNYQFDPSSGPMQMGVPNFGQPPFVNSNINNAFAVPAINNTQFGQPATAALPGILHPPVQFNMGSSSNHTGHFRPPNTGRPFRNGRNP